MPCTNCRHNRQLKVSVLFFLWTLVSAACAVVLLDTSLKMTQYLQNKRAVDGARLLAEATTLSKELLEATKATPEKQPTRELFQQVLKKHPKFHHFQIQLAGPQLSFCQAKRGALTVIGDLLAPISQNLLTPLNTVSADAAWVIYAPTTETRHSAIDGKSLSFSQTTATFHAVTMNYFQLAVCSLEEH